MPEPSPEALKAYREYIERLSPETHQGGPPKTLPLLHSPEKDQAENVPHSDAEGGNKTGAEPFRDTQASAPPPLTYLTRGNRTRAQAILKNQPPVDPEHGLVKLRAQQRRQLGQLGLFEPNPKVQYIVDDLTREHGRAVLLAGASSSVGLLPEGTDILLNHPDISNAQHDKERASVGTPKGTDNASFEETIESYQKGRKTLLFATANDVYRLAEESRQVGGARVRIVNQSFGTSPEDYAGMLARRMLLAPPGTPLHETATKVLGRDPGHRCRQTP